MKHWSQSPVTAHSVLQGTGSSVDSWADVACPVLLCASAQT